MNIVKIFTNGKDEKTWGNLPVKKTWINGIIKLEEILLMKLDDEIRTKYRLMQEERKRKYPVFRNNNASSKSSSGNGRWVTINGNHVYID